MCCLSCTVFSSFCSYELFSFQSNASKAVEQIAEEGKGTLLKVSVMSVL